VQSETEKFALLLQAHPADEGAVLAQLDKVLDRERGCYETEFFEAVSVQGFDR